MVLFRELGLKDSLKSLAVMLGGARVDSRLVATVLVGFVGVAAILRPTIERDQAWHGLMGLLSGVLIVG